jgi:lipopolysaccharide transport system ATP-binding protein
MNTVIKVENLAKCYLIDHEEKQSYTTLRDVIAKRAKKLFSFPKHLREGGGKAKQEEFWALKQVDFDVQQGDRVGVIGRNGAGKSTLLKILSRITEPTKGRIEINGRIASLLEVGTGFHPELTGRENIYLNGAILGMGRHEIKRKFDEIVDFAGVEQFLDTPVKRYSSGMYVRLAFAVAAHLEPEILVVDEVLAVGDADFQKKCLGKMNDVSKNEGRTILFVSHNMMALKQLCNRGIVLQNGQNVFNDEVNKAVEYYINKGLQDANYSRWNEEDAIGNDKIKVLKAAAYAEGKTPYDPIYTNQNIILEFEYINYVTEGVLDVTLDMVDIYGVHIAHFGKVCDTEKPLEYGKKYVTQCTFPANILNENRYIIHLMFGINQRIVAFRKEEIISFDVEDGRIISGVSFHKAPGIIHPICQWETVKNLDETNKKSIVAGVLA